MSVTYFEGTFTPTPTGLTVMNALKTAFDAATPTGWSFVEEWTENSTTWHVYKCAAATSGLPEDFHVVLADAQAGSTTLAVIVCEGYNTIAHRMRRPAYTFRASFGASTATVPSGAGGSVGDDSSLYRPAATAAEVSRTAGTGATGLSAMASLPLSSATSNWAAFFYSDGMILSIKDGSSLRYMYFGAFASLVKEASTNDPMPIFMTGSSFTSPNNHQSTGVTRSAMNAGVNARHDVSLARWHFRSLGSGSPTDPTTFDKYSAVVGPYLQPFLIFRGEDIMSINEDGTASTAGKIRGRTKYLLGAGSGTGVGWGDTITVDGDTYQAVTSTNWALKSLGA